MTIKYSGGRRIEGLILSQSGSDIRTALKGARDAVNFNFIEGTWVSENCEPVEVEFAWQRQSLKEPVSEADCICPKELAARLIRLFLNGSEENEGPIEVPFDRTQDALPLHVMSSDPAYQLAIS